MRHFALSSVVVLHAVTTEVPPIQYRQKRIFPPVEIHKKTHERSLWYLILSKNQWDQQQSTSRRGGGAQRGSKADTAMLCARAGQPPWARWELKQLFHSISPSYGDIPEVSEVISKATLQILLCRNLTWVQFLNRCCWRYSQLQRGWPPGYQLSPPPLQMGFPLLNRGLRPVSCLCCCCLMQLWTCCLCLK